MSRDPVKGRVASLCPLPKINCHCRRKALSARRGASQQFSARARGSSTGPIVRFATLSKDDSHSQGSCAEARHRRTCPTRQQSTAGSRCRLDRPHGKGWLAVHCRNNQTAPKHGQHVDGLWNQAWCRGTSRTAPAKPVAFEQSLPMVVSWNFTASEAGPHRAQFKPWSVFFRWTTAPSANRPLQAISRP